ncbi:MAG: Replicative DNA helicase [Bacteroidetes bacterium ADurb.BinA104]|nr:MAG: Replicative DNA helicase [Bacteroidetes bacterium ADurb.BinA104]
MSDNKREINIVTLNAETGSKFPADIAMLTDVIPSGANWAYYADRVKKLAQLRAFGELSERMHEVNIENIGEKLNEFSSTATMIAQSIGGNVKSARDFLLPMLESIEEAVRRKTEYSGYDTGLSSLNDVVDGLQKEYIIIGARASIGKTALGINIARALVRKGVKVGIFSLEMSGKALMLRMLSDICNLQAGMMKNGMFRTGGMEKINTQGLEMADWPLYLVDDTRGEFDKIIAKTRYMVRVLGVQVIIIDHASLMKFRDRRLQRYEQFSEMSNELQNLQRELNIPIVVMAQLGRDAEGKRPTIADLRESGAFEQDADQIWILHRERAQSADETSIPTELIVAKNRNGACGKVDLYFQPQFIRFVDKARER